MTTIDLTQASVLITGGSSGIGAGLAERLCAAGATVLVTGRNAESLDRIARANPGLRTIVSDIGKPQDREGLAAHVSQTMPQLDVLINNAGIQRRVALAEDSAEWAERQAEIDILLSGPVHFNHLLIPTMLAHGRPGMIVNVTSGGAFVPQPFAPLYSACKAALHSYTVNLRFALAHTALAVREIIPPAVATALAGSSPAHGASVEAFCDAALAHLSEGVRDEIGFGMTATDVFEAAREFERSRFAQFSQRFPVRAYEPCHG